VKRFIDLIAEVARYPAERIDALVARPEHVGA